MIDQNVKLLNLFAFVTMQSFLPCTSTRFMRSFVKCVQFTQHRYDEGNIVCYDALINCNLLSQSTVINFGKKYTI